MKRSQKIRGSGEQDGRPDAGKGVMLTKTNKRGFGKRSWSAQRGGGKKGRMPNGRAYKKREWRSL